MLIRYTEKYLERKTYSELCNIIRLGGGRYGLHSSKVSLVRKIMKIDASRIKIGKMSLKQFVKVNKDRYKNRESREKVSLERSDEKIYTVEQVVDSV